MSKRIAIGTAALAAALVVSGCADDETTPASLRVAHLSAGAPAVDFCIAPHGSGSFSGPIMKSLGETAGLAYG
jgi:hypothetical protein